MQQANNMTGKTCFIEGEFGGKTQTSPEKYGISSCCPAGNE
jgi:hypothetical protein